MRAIMATTTTPVGFTAEATRSDTAAAKPGFFARWLDRIIAARMARAEREIRPYLAGLNDERLKDLGFDGKAIENLREKHYVQAVYWS